MGDIYIYIYINIYPKKQLMDSLSLFLQVLTFTVDFETIFILIPQTWNAIDIQCILPI